MCACLDTCMVVNNGRVTDTESKLTVQTSISKFVTSLQKPAQITHIWKNNGTLLGHCLP